MYDNKLHKTDFNIIFLTAFHIGLVVMIEDLSVNLSITLLIKCLLGDHFKGLRWYIYMEKQVV